MAHVEKKEDKSVENKPCRKCSLMLFPQSYFLSSWQVRYWFLEEINILASALYQINRTCYVEQCQCTIFSYFIEFNQLPIPTQCNLLYRGQPCSLLCWKWDRDISMDGSDRILVFPYLCMFSSFKCIDMGIAWILNLLFIFDTTEYEFGLDWIWILNKYY